MASFQTGELYGDGAGAAKLLGLAYGAGDADPVYVDREVSVFVYCVVSGTAPTSVEIEAQISFDNGVSWRSQQVQYFTEAGVRALASGDYTGSGAGPHQWRVNLPPQVLARIRAKRTGGDGTTAALIKGNVRDHFGSAVDVPLSAGAADAVGGTVADDGAVDGSFPVKVGGVASTDPTLSTVANNDVVHFLSDLNRYLRVRSRAYDPTVDADKVSPTVTDADRFAGVDTLINGATGGAATYYYPSAAGLQLDEANHATFHFVLTANQTLTIEVSNDPALTSWVDFTSAGVDTTGASGTASFTNTTNVLDFEGINFYAVRVKVVAAADNACQIYLRRRFS